jgi:bis(5'-nucleosyl)-tetraphosphatase (symmetrical)
MAIYAIGDLQGCYKPLLQLLEKLRFDPSADTLWFAGDLVNRGKHSLETLRLVRSLGTAAVAVLGNHDISLIAAFHGLRKPHKSLKALVEAPDYPDLIHWLAQRPVLHVDAGLGYALCHAGISPQWNLATAQACAREIEQQLAAPTSHAWLAQVYGDKPDQWDAHAALFERHRYILNAFTRMRYCRLDGSLEFDAKGNPRDYLSTDISKLTLIPWFLYPQRQPLEVRVVFGHWSTLGYYNDARVIALDTGCVWGGQLTAIRLDTPDPVPHSVACDDYV